MQVSSGLNSKGLTIDASRPMTTGGIPHNMRGILQGLPKSAVASGNAQFKHQHGRNFTAGQLGGTI